LSSAPSAKIESTDRRKAGEGAAGVVEKGAERSGGQREGRSMPGVIMENGNGNGQHTNHDRDQRPNGVNGASHTGEKSMEKGKGRAEPQQNVTPVSPTAPHGMNGSFMSQSKQVDGKQDLIPSDIQARMNELPPQINHIVEGHLLSLNKLLSRVAQKTHNDLERTIIDLARIPIPVSVANGSGSHSVSSEDNSKENVDKKARLLKFAQEAHTELTKALVITNWSRRSGDVAKLIDLKAHLDKEKFYYEMAIHELFELKRTLGQARIPNPDLKTALEVLTTGKVTWMPDVSKLT
jgi:mediator of RNA polymerase II transcription subunit 14